MAEFSGLWAYIPEHVQVINLSLGGPSDPLLDRLVGEALRRGIVVVGAVPPSADVTGFPVSVAGVIGVDVASRPGAHYDFSSGSSLATAHVSGVVALLLTGSQPVSSRQIHAALMASSGAGVAGAKVINPCWAVETVYVTAGKTCQ